MLSPFCFTCSIRAFTFIVHRISFGTPNVLHRQVGHKTNRGKTETESSKNRGKGRLCCENNSHRIVSIVIAWALTCYAHAQRHYSYRR
jgi:hypothetical protein